MALPIALIIVGVLWIFGSYFDKGIKKKIKELDKTNPDKGEYYATFAGQEHNIANEEFKGCKLNATFGGIKFNLRDAKVKKDAVIDASSIFGGIQIKVPKDVNVQVSSSSMFGGVENKVKNDEKNKVTIYINATCLFGGVEVK